MRSVYIPSWLQKLLRYFFAYLLFILFGLLGLILLVQLHTVMVATGSLISGLYGLVRFLSAWGFFFLLGAYIICIVLMEASMNKAARDGDILRRGARIFAIEGGLALVTVLVPWITELLLVAR